MDTGKAYDLWSEQYDTNINKTRDLEAKALRQILENIPFTNCLEIGCGTGKNTEWLITRAKQIMAIDLSGEMLAKAKQKISSAKVHFQQADITKSWSFAHGPYDLLVFSLVLEHIEKLDSIFRKAYKATALNGHVYIGELHPFKQYSGTKARFEDEGGQQILTCFSHNISDFVQFAKKYNFDILDINEHFDNNDRTSIPRILTILLRQK